MTAKEEVDSAGEHETKMLGTRTHLATPVEPSQETKCNLAIQTSPLPLQCRLQEAHTKVWIPLPETQIDDLKLLFFFIILRPKAEVGP